MQPLVNARPGDATPGLFSAVAAILHSKAPSRRVLAAALTLAWCMATSASARTALVAAGAASGLYNVIDRLADDAAAAAEATVTTSGASASDNDACTAGVECSAGSSERAGTIPSPGSGDEADSELEFAGDQHDALSAALATLALLLVDVAGRHALLERAQAAPKRAPFLRPLFALAGMRVLLPAAPAQAPVQSGPCEKETVGEGAAQAAETIDERQSASVESAAQAPDMGVPNSEGLPGKAVPEGQPSASEDAMVSTADAAADAAAPDAEFPSEGSAEIVQASSAENGALCTDECAPEPCSGAAAVPAEDIPEPRAARQRRLAAVVLATLLCRDGAARLLCAQRGAVIGVVALLECPCLHVYDHAAACIAAYGGAAAGSSGAAIEALRAFAAATCPARLAQRLCAQLMEAPCQCEPPEAMGEDAANDTEAAPPAVRRALQGAAMHAAVQMALLQDDLPAGLELTVQLAHAAQACMDAGAEASDTLQV